MDYEGKGGGDTEKILGGEVLLSTVRLASNSSFSVHGKMICIWHWWEPVEM